jgi:hypothetical protein
MFLFMICFERVWHFLCNEGQEGKETLALTMSNELKAAAALYCLLLFLLSNIAFVTCTLLISSSQNFLR